MPRPRYAPGSTHAVRLRRARGRQWVAHYVASRFSLPERWAAALVEHGCVRVNDVLSVLTDVPDFVAGTF